MSIIRRKRRGSFAIIPNAVANDTRLTFEELGLLVYLLAKPDDWSVHVNELKKRGSVGRDKVYQILKRMVELRYMHRTRIVDPKTGQFRGYEYEIRDDSDAAISPENIEESPCPAIQETGRSDVSPFPELPYTANQYAIIKPTLTNTPQKNTPLEPKVEKADENANAFTTIFASWAVEPTRSKRRPHNRWRQLSAPERENAAKGVENYLAHCKKRKCKPCSILSYLKDSSLWEFSALAVEKPPKPIRLRSASELRAIKEQRKVRNRTPEAAETQRTKHVEAVMQKYGFGRVS